MYTYQTSGPYASWINEIRDTGVMHWAASPTPHGAFTVRTGSGIDLTADSRMYVPGAVHSIYVSVSDFSMRYVGLVLYATNGVDPKTGKEKHVGTWNVTYGRPFQTPSTCGNGPVVTHKGADFKPIEEKFFCQSRAHDCNIVGVAINITTLSDVFPMSYSAQGMRPRIRQGRSSFVLCSSGVVKEL